MRSDQNRHVMLRYLVSPRISPRPTINTYQTYVQYLTDRFESPHRLKYLNKYKIGKISFMIQKLRYLDSIKFSNFDENRKKNEGILSNLSGKNTLTRK